jgi:hypothetical protein
LQREGALCSCVPKPQLHPNQTPAANSIPVTIRQNLARGRVNQVAMEEAQNASMNGTFLANSNPALTIP